MRKSQYNNGDLVVVDRYYYPFKANSICVVTDCNKRNRDQIEVMDTITHERGRIPTKYLKKPPRSFGGNA